LTWREKLLSVLCVLLRQGTWFVFGLYLWAFLSRHTHDMQDMLQSGMAGISFVGADICGFNNYATEELCARWAAAGAWQPFARNHHADGFQEFFT